MVAGFFRGLGRALSVAVPSGSSLPRKLRPGVSCILLMLEGDFIVVTIVLFLVCVFSRLAALGTVTCFYNTTTCLFRFLTIASYFRAGIPRARVFVVCYFNPLCLLLKLDCVLWFGDSGWGA